MKIKREEPKVKPQLKMSEEFLNLKTLSSSVIVQHLEESIKLRELPVEKRLKRNPTSPSIE